MSKKFFILSVLVSCFLLFSCKTVHEVLANTKFDETLGETELKRECKGNVYPFTLNNKAAYGCPVIKFPINGQEGIFLVDTGAPDCGLSDKGVQKSGRDVEKLNKSCLSPYKEILQQINPKLYGQIKDNPEKLYNQMKKDMKKGVNFIFEKKTDDDFSKFWYGQIYDSKMDGIIGLELLKKHNRVTFDFVNNVLILDDEKLDGTETPMAFDTNNSCCIEFSYKNKKEVGILDTGNYTFSPRNNFGKDNNIYNLNSDFVTTDVFYKKTPKKLPIVHTFNNIEICNQKFSNIKGVYSNCWFSTYSRSSQEYLTRVNGIGCELFKGKIIQFDFVDMIFIVK